MGDLTKWQIPASTVSAPGSKLIVFASAKDRAANSSELHTTCTLPDTGGSLALVAPDGTTILDSASSAFYPGAAILDEARIQSGELVDRARAEAEAMLFERDEAMVAAHRQGADRMAEAEAASYRLLLDAEMARSDAVTNTERALERNGREMEASRAAAVEETERLANEIVGAARREEIRLASRLQELRSAVVEVETKITDLAALTTPHTTHIAEVIDLTVVDGETLLTGSGRS